VDDITKVLFPYSAQVFYLGAAFVLLAHLISKSRSIMPFIGLIAIVTALVFVILWHAPEPIGLSLLIALLVLYGATIFVLLSDLMLMGFAKFLTAKRGAKWVKELDYVYLTIGTIGILATVNRLDIVRGRFEARTYSRRCSLQRPWLSVLSKRGLKSAAGTRTLQPLTQLLPASGENHTLESGGNARSVRCSVPIRGYQASDSFH
jgi:hypothetical protein